MSDPCRDAFETWCEMNLDQSAPIPSDVKVFIVDGLWRGWQADWSTRPVAEVPSVDELAKAFWEAFIRGRDLPMPPIDDNSDACNGIKAIHALLIQRQGGRS